MHTVTAQPATAARDLPPYRLHLLRAGYLFMGLGLAVVKWPLIVNGADSLPLFEGVVACLLTAMSLLAFLGLRYPVKLLPVLLFESAWKLLWLGVVALPRAVAGDLDAATGEVVVSCSLVVVILAVIPPGGTCGGSTCSSRATDGPDCAARRRVAGDRPFRSQAIW